MKRYSSRAEALRIARGCLCVLLLALLPQPLLAQHDERAVRAAFIFNLTKYVEWPHPSDELVIGFVGEDGLGETLQKVIAGKTSNRRVIRVIVAPPDDQLEHCDVVYVASSSPARIRSVLARIEGKNILSVGDSDTFARQSGMVGLVRTGDEIQIQVNLQAVQAGDLKISSRLLNLAVIIGRGEEQGANRALQ